MDTKDRAVLAFGAALSANGFLVLAVLARLWAAAGLAALVLLACCAYVARFVDLARMPQAVYRRRRGA